MLPMLARPWNEKLISFPAFVQPKLNGLRALWLFSNQRLQSRGHGLDDKPLWWPDALPIIHGSLLGSLMGDVLEFMRQELRGYTFEGLDGEIYSHGSSLQKINSWGGVNRNSAHKNHYLLGFHIFDVISNAPFSKRFDALQVLYGLEIPGISLVPTVYCGTPGTFETLYDLYYRRECYEGIMWRDPRAPYGTFLKCKNKENRWDYIVKRKPRQDMLVTIQHGVEGNGKQSGMLGACVCTTDQGATFSVGSGLDDAERVAYWIRREELPGVKMRIEFEVLSDGLVPLKPTISCIHLPID